MDFGGGEFYHWLCVLEGICGLGIIGLFIHCLIMFGESENPMWWLPLIFLALIVAAPLIAWATMDFWIWMF
jgi:hypothetical protein